MNVLRRVLIVLALVLCATPSSARAQRTPDWMSVPSGVNLMRPAFWEGAAGTTASDGVVTVDASESADEVQVFQYGPRIRPTGDFGVLATIQSDTDDLAAISLIDSSSMEPAWAGMPRVEFGLLDGEAIVAVYDGSDVEPIASHSMTSDAPHGPVTISMRRLGGEFVVSVSGIEQLRRADPGLFLSGDVVFGARVFGEGNQLVLYQLSVEAPPTRAAETEVTRCAPARLLVAGDASATDTGLWFVWPDESSFRRVEASINQRSFLVGISPDGRWAAYYQRSPLAIDERFIVDTWVIDLATDERFKLAEQTAPLGWIPDSSAVVLSARADMMARVPTGEIVPTEAPIVTPDAMKAVTSPDGRLRAVVTTGIMGSVTGVVILDVTTGEPIMTSQTGRGAVTLAWSPDSTRLAFTASFGGQNELLWRLRIADVSDRRVHPVEITADMQVHSVAWAPPLPGCAGRTQPRATP